MKSKTVLVVLELLILTLFVITLVFGDISGEEAAHFGSMAAVMLLVALCVAKNGWVKALGIILLIPALLVWAFFIHVAFYGFHYS